MYGISHFYNILVISYCVLPVAAFKCTSIGTEFVLGFIGNEIPQYRQISIYAWVTNANEETVHIRVTAPFTGTNSNYSVSSHDSLQIQFNSHLQVYGPGTGELKEEKGIRIRASSPVRVFAGSEWTTSWSLAGWAVLPTSSLGRLYSGLTFSHNLGGENGAIQNNVLVVGVEEGETVVEWSGGAWGPGGTSTLHPLDTLYISSNLTDLTGIRISSSRPVALFSGNQLAEVPLSNGGFARCYAASMLLPLECLGTRFLLSSMVGKYELSEIAGDIQIVAFEDDTRLQVAYKGQYRGGNNSLGSPSLSVVPPLSSFCRGTVLFHSIGHYVTPTSIPWTHYINIIVEYEYRNWIRLDEQTLDTASWKFVGSETSFVVTKPLLSVGLHSVSCAPLDCYFYGMAYGFSMDTEYSFNIAIGDSEIIYPTTRTASILLPTSTISSKTSPRSTTRGLTIATQHTKIPSNCSGKVCLHGGTCVIVNETSWEQRWNCLCIDGWSGSRCQTSSNTEEASERVEIVAGTVGTIFILLIIVVVVLLFRRRSGTTHARSLPAVIYANNSTKMDNISANAIASSQCATNTGYENDTTDAASVSTGYEIFSAPNDPVKMSRTLPSIPDFPPPSPPRSGESQTPPDRSSYWSRYEQPDSDIFPACVYGGNEIRSLSTYDYINQSDVGPQMDGAREEPEENVGMVKDIMEAVSLRQAYGKKGDP